MVVFSVLIRNCEVGSRLCISFHWFLTDSCNKPWQIRSRSGTPRTDSVARWGAHKPCWRRRLRREGVEGGPQQVCTLREIPVRVSIVFLIRRELAGIITKLKPLPNSTGLRSSSRTLSQEGQNLASGRDFASPFLNR